jgi:hypothetical protein
MVQMQALEYASGQAGGIKSLLEQLGHQRVCEECLRMTLLPAASAGTMVLMAVRKG